MARSVLGSWMVEPATDLGLRDGVREHEAMTLNQFTDAHVCSFICLILKYLSSTLLFIQQIPSEC